jgi:hypothetical protein
MAFVSMEGGVSLADPASCPTGYLASRGRALPQNSCDIIEGKVEHVVQDECYTLTRRELIEDEQQRHAD